MPLPTTTTPEAPIQPILKCPADMVEVIPIGKKSTLIKLQKPDTNVDWERYIDSQPLWAKKLEVELTPGVYPIVYRARSPNSQLHEICRTMLTVKETKAPRVMSCPESSEIQLEQNELSRPIHWAEPKFESPNHLKEVYKNRIPGSKFKPGIHKVEYVAVDMEGLEARCEFTITVKGGKIRPVVIPQLNRKQILGVNRATLPPPLAQERTTTITPAAANDQQYLLCPSKPPVKVEPGFPVSKIRIYFPSLTAAQTDLQSQSPSPLINNNPDNNQSNQSNTGPSETPLNTLVASSNVGVSSAPTMSVSSSQSGKNVNVTTDATGSSYENFIEILFHLPSYQINSSSS